MDGEVIVWRSAMENQLCSDSMISDMGGYVVMLRRAGVLACIVLVSLSQTQYGNRSSIYFHRNSPNLKQIARV